MFFHVFFAPKIRPTLGATVANLEGGWISYFVPTTKFPQGLVKVLWDDLGVLATGFGFLEQ